MGGWFTQERLARLAARTWYHGRRLKRQHGQRVFISWFAKLREITRQIDAGQLEDVKRPRIECERELCNGQKWCCGHRSHRIHVSSLEILSEEMVGPVSWRLKGAAVRSVAAIKGSRKRRREIL